MSGAGEDVLLYIAIIGTLISVLALVLFPAVGMALTFLVRPLIDATWADKFVGGYGLTDMIGVAVPLAVFAFALTRVREDQRFSKIPLLWIWIIYSADIFLFSLILLTNEGVEAGANVFFRQINAVVGYYIGQVAFRDGKSRVTFFRVLVAATLFPLTVGLYQLLTGYEWVHADTEGIARYVGMYHDAFTVRYYMLQGILAAVVLMGLRKARFNLENAMLTAYLLCALIVMYRAYSKSAVITIVVWTLLWGILRRKFLFVAFFAVAGVMVGGVYLPEIFAQVGQMFNKEIGAIHGQVDVNRTFAGRWYGWHELLAQWNGFSGLAKTFGSGITSVGAHNDYLMMLMHGGVIGLATYVLLIGSTIVRLMKNAFVRPDPIALAGLMAIALWCIDSIGLVPSTYPGYEWFIWAVVGISLRVRADERAPRSVKAPVRPNALLA